MMQHGLTGPVHGFAVFLFSKGKNLTEAPRISHDATLLSSLQKLMKNVMSRLQRCRYEHYSPL